MLLLSVLPAVTVRAAGSSTGNSLCLPARTVTWDDLQKHSLRQPLPHEVIDGYYQGVEPKEKGYAEIGWDFITTPELGPMGGGVTLANLAGLLGREGGGLDDILTDLGGAVAVIQFVMDINSGNDMAQVNFAKSATFWAVGRFNFSSALKISAVGISLIDYSLNQLGTAAQKGKQNYWYKSYKNYYDQEFGRQVKDMPTWERLVFQQYRGDVKKALTEGMMGFWGDPFRKSYEKQKYIWSVSEPNQAEKEQIRDAYLVDILPTLRNYFKMRQNESQRKAVFKVQSNYDDLREMLLKEVVFSGTVSSEGGLPLSGAEVTLFGEHPSATAADGRWSLSTRACEIYRHQLARGTGSNVELTAGYRPPGAGAPVEKTETVTLDMLIGIFAAGGVASPVRDQPPVAFVLPVNEVNKLVLSPLRVELGPGTAASVKAEVEYSDGSREDVTASSDCIWAFDRKGILAVDRGNLSVMTASEAEEKVKLSAVYAKEGDQYRSEKAVTVIVYALPGKIAPDVIGKSAKDAREILKKARLNVDIRQGQQYTNAYQEGHVVSQTPAAGDPVKEGEKVTVVLNGAVKVVTVPNLVGEMEHDARTIMARMRLVISVADAALHDPDKPVRTVLLQNPKAGVSATVGSTVAVTVNPEQRASIGIEVAPDKGSYQIGEKIRFAEKVLKRNTNNTYTFTWMKDGDFARKGDSFTTSFDTPGEHYVQLVLESSDPGENDAIIRNIHVEHPPDPTVGIDVGPAGPYTPGTQVTFSRRVSDLPDAREFRWYVNGKYIDSGTSLLYKLGGKGKYEITLEVRRGSGDELKAKKTITVGDEPIKALGRWVNKFDPVGTTADLKVCSSYWQGGYAYSQGIGAVVSRKGKWSKCAIFDRVGAVGGYDLYTGEQADGHNSGWIAYAPEGRSQLRFRVYSFRFGEPGKDFGAWKGYRRREGTLDTHGTLVPSSISFVKKQSRAGTVQWQTDDGKTCTARIHKFKSGGQGTITKNVFAIGGVDYEECAETGTVEDGYDPRDDPGMASPGSATAAGGSNPFVQQFQDGGSTGSGGTSSGGSPGSAGNLSNVTVGRNNVTITFWDHGKEDGDIINIYLNGSLLQGGLTLKREKRKFDVTLNSGSNTFEVEAVNEGSLPPNTASVRISDVTKGRGTQIYERQSGERASMNLFAP